VNAGRAADRIGGRSGYLHPERSERLGLALGTIPCNYRIATLCGSFGKRGTKQSGAKKCDMSHVLSLDLMWC
jgi:hypothetical protein